MRAWVMLALAGCGFAGSGADPGDDTADGDARIDGRKLDDGGGADGGIDARVDAMIDAAPAACPTAGPPGCTSIQFECGATPASCYALCFTVRNHAAAENDCVAWGGHLASLAVMGERMCVDDVVEAQGTQDVWNGARQDTSGGGVGAGWTYLDGTTWGGFSGWAAGQPDDLDGVEDGDEDCASLESSMSYQNNDDDCAQSQAYLCERPKL